MRMSSKVMNTLAEIEAGWLLDVNVILASRWRTHAERLSTKAWVDSVGA